MNVEDIPADEVVIMSELWHRAFKAAGCNPQCHGCYKYLKVGDKFKLATINTFAKYSEHDHKYSESREVMLCNTCVPEDVEERKMSLVAEANKARPRGGCFRINGKIIH